MGAILTQHTAWTNAALAIAALRSRRLLDPTRLAAVSVDELAPVIRSAGTYRLKARRVHDFTMWLLERFGGRWERLRRVPGVGSWTLEVLALTGQGRYDQLPAGDLNYLKLVGRLRSGGNPYARATEEDVRELFAPYGEWAALAAAHLSRSPVLAGSRWSRRGRLPAAA